ncbi:MAG: TIGR02206 family membrane protein [Oscillospiraceae bacterium]|jgi:hypothetical integral membrane protein (TIGR02206 family)|nr:TIGR02206 family membrane protein [Oscillospiraceae bacterium]
MGFFTFIDSTGIPQSGFTTFGATHLLMLVGLGLIVALLCYGYRRLGAERGRFLLICVAGLALLQEVAKQVVILTTLDAYPIGELPLHLCGLFLFVNFVYALKPNRYLGELLYCLGLPGAFMALITPDWSAYPLVNFFCLHSFTVHAWLISIPLMLLFSGQLRPNYKNLWFPMLFLAVVSAPLYFFNKAVGANFLFLLTPPADTPLVAIQSITGESLYLLGLAVLVVVAWFFMYLPWIISDKRKAKQSQVA